MRCQKEERRAISTANLSSRRNKLSELRFGHQNANGGEVSEGARRRANTLLSSFWLDEDSRVEQRNTSSSLLDRGRLSLTVSPPATGHRATRHQMTRGKAAISSFLKEASPRLRARTSRWRQRRHGYARLLAECKRA